MPSIIECDNCGYSRSSEEDGQMFHEVCGICYDDECPTMVKPKMICNECFPWNNVIDPGESLFT